jgi:hypothetical protein
MKQVFYHYTSVDALKWIQDDRLIKKSSRTRKNRRDARFGSGVYLTQVPPSAGRDYILFNNYDGGGKPEKVSAYVKFELDADKVEECTDSDYGRDIFLYKGKDLKLTADMKAEFLITDAVRA